MSLLKSGLVVSMFLLVPAMLTEEGLGQEKPDTPEEKVVPAKAIEIPDEPRAIDPATLLPPSVTAKVTVKFEQTSLTDVIKWIQEEQKIPVLLDKPALSQEGILASELITEQLNDAPLYLLLDRLQMLGLGWYLEESVLRITTIDVAQTQMSTASFNLSDLFDAGIAQMSLIETVLQCTGGKWEEVDGEGGNIMLLGDVLFIRNSDAVLREAAGLFAALRQPARRTFTFDSPENAGLRTKLEQRVTVDFEELPLESAIQELSEMAKAEVRLDRRALRASRVRDRAPVTLKLADQKLETVVNALLAQLGLTSMLRDGVLWVTTKPIAEEYRKSAVFDVRDLCRSPDEYDSLVNAIQSQTSGPWQDISGVGATLESPRIGTLVIRQTETQLNQILQLLEDYRVALRDSKPRVLKVEGPKDVITRYYRLPTAMCRDLQVMLPRLIRDETWLSEQNPKAPGDIKIVTSLPAILDEKGNEILAEYKVSKGNAPLAMVVPYSVLIIRQFREVHEEITNLVFKIKTGDHHPGLYFGVNNISGKGGGSEEGEGAQFGGFGGGFFSIPQKGMRDRD